MAGIERYYPNIVFLASDPLTGAFFAFLLLMQLLFLVAGVLRYYPICESMLWQRSLLGFSGARVAVCEKVCLNP